MILRGSELIQALPLNDLYTDYMTHHRLMVFAIKGRECVTCDREGVFLLMTQSPNGDKHVDLYTKDFVMMTVDHAISKKQAKELGWTKKQIESIDNKQPMCGPCNWAKGHKEVTNEEWRAVRANTANKWQTGDSAIWELFTNTSVFNVGASHAR